MVMLIKPIQGQPGLFRTEADGLGATRYGGTQTFSRSRARALADLNAVRYGGTQTFVRSSSHALASLGFTPSENEAIAEDRVAGLGVKIVAYLPPQLTVSQTTLDSLVRPALTQLGFDVSSPEFALTPITWSWKKDGDVWTAVIASGPAAFIGQEGAMAIGQSPTAADLADSPNAIAQFSISLRPKDGLVSQADIDVVKQSLNNARTAWKKAVPGSTFEMNVSIKSLLPEPSYWWAWALGAIGIVAGVAATQENRKISRKFKKYNRR